MNALITHPHSPATPADDHRRTIFLPELKSRFLRHLCEMGNVGQACTIGRVSRQTAYRERRRDPAFAALWDAAMLSARIHAEAELADRALCGVEEVVWYHGEEVGRRRRFSDRLLLAHLGRLDKIAQRADAWAAMDALDDAMDALAAGRAVVLDDSAGVRAKAGTSGGGVQPHSRIPAQAGTSGGRAQRLETPAFAGDQVGDQQSAQPPFRVPVPENSPLDTVPHVPHDAEPVCIEERLVAMERARPRRAVPPSRMALPPGVTPGDVEEWQLEAFEEGVAEWWRIDSLDALEAALVALLDDEEPAPEEPEESRPS